MFVPLITDSVGQPIGGFREAESGRSEEYSSEVRKKPDL